MKRFFGVTFRGPMTLRMLAALWWLAVLFTILMIVATVAFIFFDGVPAIPAAVSFFRGGDAAFSWAQLMSTLRFTVQSLITLLVIRLLLELIASSIDQEERTPA
jgi:hypothetical protein